MRLDRALGPTLNIGKCARGYVTAPRERIAPCRHDGLSAIPLRKSFRYLGIDLLMGHPATAPVAKRRMAKHGKRLNIVKMLPVHQRGAAVADVVSARWAEGGTPTPARRCKLR